MTIKQTIQTDTGSISVINPSAWFIPEFTLSRKIGNSLYTITGSYDGTETLNKKLTRIMENKMEQDQVQMEEIT